MEDLFDMGYHFIMSYKFTTIQLSQSLLNFSFEPQIIIAHNLSSTSFDSSFSCSIAVSGLNADR